MIEQTAAVAAGGANSVRGQVQARPCLLFHRKKEDLLQIVTRASARDFTVYCFYEQDYVLFPHCAT